MKQENPKPSSTYKWRKERTMRCGVSNNAWETKPSVVEKKEEKGVRNQFLFRHRITLSSAQELQSDNSFFPFIVSSGSGKVLVSDREEGHMARTSLHSLPSNPSSSCLLQNIYTSLVYTSLVYISLSGVCHHRSCQSLTFRLKIITKASPPHKLIQKHFWEIPALTMWYLSP